MPDDRALVPASQTAQPVARLDDFHELEPIYRGRPEVAELLVASGEDAFSRVLAWFQLQIRNAHTRKAYALTVKKFFAFAAELGVTRVQEITPQVVAAYLEVHPGKISSQKRELAAIRKLFDWLVTGHVIEVSPAHSVQGRRLSYTEGLTPGFTVKQVEELLASIDRSTLVGKRDRAIIGTLAWTAARAGAVAKLKLGDYQPDGTQFVFLFEEKGGKLRKIPVRHDLEQILGEWLEAADIALDGKDAPLWRKTPRTVPKGGHEARKNTLRPLGETPYRDDFMSGHDILRMVKRRLKDSGLPGNFSCHSFRVTTLTDLLSSGVPKPDVQYLAGHADERTTGLYDRTQREVTRNIVERISIQAKE